MEHVDLGAYRQLVIDDAAATRKIAELKASLKEWTEWRAKRRDMLAELVGPGGMGAIDGRVVVTVAPKNQYAGERFVREHPDLYEQYKVPTTTYKVDWEALRKLDPDLVAQYQVNTFTSNWDK